MNTFKDRVRIESRELGRRTTALAEFLKSNRSDDICQAERQRLNLQLYLMGQYQTVLFQRIDAFGP